MKETLAKTLWMMTKTRPTLLGMFASLGAAIVLFLPNLDPEHASRWSYDLAFNLAFTMIGAWMVVGTPLHVRKKGALVAATDVKGKKMMIKGIFFWGMSLGIFVWAWALTHQPEGLVKAAWATLPFTIGLVLSAIFIIFELSPELRFRMLCAQIGLAQPGGHLCAVKPNHNLKFNNLKILLDKDREHKTGFWMTLHNLIVHDRSFETPVALEDLIDATNKIATHENSSKFALFLHFGHEVGTKPLVKIVTFDSNTGKVKSSTDLTQHKLWPDALKDHNLWTALMEWFDKGKEEDCQTVNMTLDSSNIAQIVNTNQFTVTAHQKMMGRKRIQDTS